MWLRSFGKVEGWGYVFGVNTDCGEKGDFLHVPFPFFEGSFFGRCFFWKVRFSKVVFPFLFGLVKVGYFKRGSEYVRVVGLCLTTCRITPTPLGVVISLMDW